MFFKNLDCLGAASRRSDGECQGRGRRPQSAEDPVQGVPAADLVTLEGGTQIFLIIKRTVKNRTFLRLVQKNGKNFTNFIIQ